MNERYILVSFENPKSKQVRTLKYKLFNNHLTEKWFSLFNYQINHKDYNLSNSGEFFGADFDNIDDVVVCLVSNIQTFNELAEKNGYPERLKFQPSVNMTRQILVEMHDKFEEYAHDKRFLAHSDFQKTLQDFNINIHRAESFLPEIISNGSHIQIIPQPVIHVELESEDYDSFTTDFNWGNLYLAYGMSGQPTLNSFYGRSEPRPQDCMTAGLQLMFLNDLKLSPELRNECREYHLMKNGLDINDPHSALGYIRIGELDEQVTDRKKFMKELSAFSKVISLRSEGLVTFPSDKLHFTTSGAGKHVLKKREINNLIIDERTNQFIKDHSSLNHEQFSLKQNKDLLESSWPLDQEIFYHLDYRPYIDLNISFNPKPILEEAFRAINYFVKHRSYDQSQSIEGGGEWKSLSLQSVEGDYKKTSYHTEYGYSHEDSNNLYRKTVFSQLCPNTMSFIEQITDSTKCERIRFMLLEPGAKIHTHRDNKDGHVGMALNISLNMPAGCEFWADLNRDGSKNEYSVSLPFSDNGSVLLFNNGKYHSVVNNSSTPRMHIIIHGPVRMNDQQILELARKQNGVQSRKEILELLGQKKIKLIEDLELSKTFYSEWKSLGYSVTNDNFNYDFLILRLIDPSDKFREEVFDKITFASIFPKKFESIMLDDIHMKLMDSLSSGKKYAVIVAEGTFFSDIRQFSVEIPSLFQKMHEENSVLLGHILDKSSSLPYMHEQFLIIDLEKWLSVDCEPLGKLFTTDLISFPSYDRSDDSFHDDYTPFWIKPGTKIKSKSGHAGWCTNLMAKSLQKGYSISTLPLKVKSLKDYCYPLEGANDNRFIEIRKKISSYLELNSRLIFFFNNEQLDFMKLPNFNPVDLISVCAGFKPFKLVDLFFRDSQIRKSHLIDYSEGAVNYFKKLLHGASTAEIAKLISDLSQNNPGEKFSFELASNSLDAVVRDYFSNNENQLLHCIQQLKKSQVNKMDFVGNLEAFLELFDINYDSVAWISNSFYCNPVYYLFTKEEADQKFLKLGAMLGKKYQERAWRHRSSYTIIIGNSPEARIRSMVTDGCIYDKEFILDDWIPLN
jgi:hypothetical protein